MILKFKPFYIIIFAFILLLSVFIKKICDYGDYNPTVIVETYNLKNNRNTKLLKGEMIVDEFRSKNNNLGIISILFTTHNRFNDDYLLFSIKEKGQKDWYYTNKYKVDQFQDYQYFPFGFPVIKNSAGKIYQIQVESVNGRDNSYVEIIGKTKYLSKYGFPLGYLKQNIKEIPYFILAKIASLFNHISLKEYFGILISILSLFILFRFTGNNFLLREVGEVNKKTLVPLYSWLCVLGLFLVNLLVNGPIRLKSFAYGDDLHYWNLFNNNRTSFINFVFNTIANKFRPVLNGVFFMILTVIGNNTWFFGLLNLILNFSIAIVLFFIFCKLTKSIIASFGLSMAFIFSRFAYYNITQALGLMEAISLLLSVFVLYLAWCYLNTNKIKYFWLSLEVFILLMLTHERFITLLLLYLIVIIFSKINLRKKIWLFIVSTLPVMIILALKIFVLKIRPLDGTAGTDILQTFDISSFFEFFTSGCLYLFGYNAGPLYLNGIPSQAVPRNINILILIGYICLFLILMCFIVVITNNRKDKLKDNIKNFVLFFTFIFSTLIAASVTIRLEMRWLYVPFVGFLFLLAYMLGILLRYKKVGTVSLFLFLLWLGMNVRLEVFYRSYYKNIYYWSNQTFGNELYTETIKKYGNNFWNYDTYITCVEGYSQTLVACDNYVDLNLYFNQYDKERTQAKVYFIDDLSQFPVGDKSIILFFDKQKQKFIKMKN